MSITTLRLVIHRHARLLGHFESSTPWSKEAMRDLAQRLPASDGYQLELQYAHGERRLLESTPTGIRVLSAQALFTPLALTALESA